MSDGSGSRSPWRAAAGIALALVATGAFFLLLHNYGLNLLPYQRRVIAAAEIRPDAVQPSFAYVVKHAGGVSDEPRELRSRLRFREDGRNYARRGTNLHEIRVVGGDWYAHLPGEVLFATSDNSDPRANGRSYAIEWPMLYSRAVGRGSAVVLLACLAALWALRRPTATAAPPNGSAHHRWARWAALVVFTAGLWANTGTRAPYGITFAPVQVDRATGHVYNQDHVHFRVLFAFVDGEPRETWSGALLLRRILYPVLAYPAMKLAGFEAGGVAMNFIFAVAAFTGVVAWMRRTAGDRAADAAAWLFALYPGAAYWIGMPYSYALIVPGGVLLTIALAEIDRTPTRSRLAFWAFAMGLTYLAYDFAAIFLPATVLLLLWRRRWIDLVLALVLSSLPLVIWLLALRFAFGQPLGNSNSAVYQAVWTGFLSGGAADWFRTAPRLADTAAAVFFGANFFFLPALFLAALLAGPWLSPARLVASEVAILLAAIALFLIVNLAGDYGGWNLGGSWIARLYQPVFAAMIFYLARAWAARPASPRFARRISTFLLAAALGGNGLVVFGPVMRNPGRVSEEVYFRFYTHTPAARFGFYEMHLNNLPVRLLGFGRPEVPQN